MNTIKPKKLQKGDTIGFIALSGCVKKEEKILKAKKYFEDLGYKIVFSKNIFDKKRYLAGEDSAKIESLEEFFKNPEIDAILCVRGGYGAIRIVNKLDYEIIKTNPKIFAGFSDVTAYSLMMLKRAGLITFSAPMVFGDFGEDEISEFTSEHFFNALENTENLEVKPENPTVYYEGIENGILFGGNLSTVVSLCGQDFIPDEDFIFFAEDLNEESYRIDKMFRQLLNIEQFRNNLKGIALGEFLDVSKEEYLHELFDEIGQEIKKPVMSGFKFSHAKDKITVPIGANVTLDTNKKILNIEKYLI